MRLLVAAIVTTAGLLVLPGGGSGVDGQAARRSYPLTAVVALTEALPQHGAVAVAVLARFELPSRCPPGRMCKFTRPRPRGAANGVITEQAHGWHIRFRVTKVYEIVWDPFSGVREVSLRGLVTRSDSDPTLGGASGCAQGDEIYLDALRAPGTLEHGASVRCSGDAAHAFPLAFRNPAVRLAGPALTPQWTITGAWRTVQSGRYSATWSFHQTKDRLSGTVTIPWKDATAQGMTSNVGTIEPGGTLRGDHIDMVVAWPRNANGVALRGRYVGDVDSPGTKGRGIVTNGLTWNVLSPKAKAPWKGAGTGTCVGYCPTGDRR